MFKNLKIKISSIHHVYNTRLSKEMVQCLKTPQGLGNFGIVKVDRSALLGYVIQYQVDRPR